MNISNKGFSTATTAKLLTSRFIIDDDDDDIAGEATNEKSVRILSKEEVLARQLEGVCLPDSLVTRLYQHQREGVVWLHKLFLDNKSGILGDDMGLGKTFQVCCLLTGLLRKKSISRALIVAPVSVMEGWQRELIKHCSPHIKGLHIEVLNAEMSKKKRINLLGHTFHSDRPTIIITSYSLVSIMVDDFTGIHRSSLHKDDHRKLKLWDYTILDEGHVIKNPQTNLTKAVNMLKSKYRLLLTGTPIQNNLTEFWSLLNWVTQGKVFGSRAGFQGNYGEPIMKGQQPDAEPHIKRRASEALNRLMALVRPILLQRKKIDHEEILKLPNKIEVVLWVPLSDEQNDLYRRFLDGSRIKDALSRSTYPVEIINHLKTICRHPFLIEASQNANKHDNTNNPSVAKSSSYSDSIDNSDDDYGGSDNDGDDDNFFTKPHRNSSNRRDINHKRHNQSILSSLGGLTAKSANTTAPKASFSLNKSSVFEVAERSPPCAELLKKSIKLRLLVSICSMMIKNNHKVLIFSQSKLMLDIIQKVLDNQSLPSYRIDGSVSVKDRQVIIDSFNEKEDDMVDSSRDKSNLGIGTYFDSNTNSSNSSSNNSSNSSNSKHRRKAPRICLLTTRACGYGITLTGADRVVIFDPSWNPAEDRQAVDRAYRIGQWRDVVVYRLISAGSVEEKMYEKQVFKDGVRVVAESGRSNNTYFHSGSDIFTLGTVGECEVLDKITEISSSYRLHELDNLYFNKNMNRDTNHTSGAFTEDDGSSYLFCDEALGCSRHDLLYKEKGLHNEKGQTSLNRNLVPKAKRSKKNLTIKKKSRFIDDDDDDDDSDYGADESDIVYDLDLEDDESFEKVDDEPVLSDRVVYLDGGGISIDDESYNSDDSGNSKKINKKSDKRRGYMRTPSKDEETGVGWGSFGGVNKIVLYENDKDQRPPNAKMPRVSVICLLDSADKQSDKDRSLKSNFKNPDKVSPTKSKFTIDLTSDVENFSGEEDIALDNANGASVPSVNKKNNWRIIDDDDDDFVNDFSFMGANKTRVSINKIGSGKLRDSLLSMAKPYFQDLTSPPGVEMKESHGSPSVYEDRDDHEDEDETEEGVDSLSFGGGYDICDVNDYYPEDSNDDDGDRYNSDSDNNNNNNNNNNNGSSSNSNSNSNNILDRYDTDDIDNRLRRIHDQQDGSLSQDQSPSMTSPSMMSPPHPEDENEDEIDVTASPLSQGECPNDEAMSGGGRCPIMRKVVDDRGSDGDEELDIGMKCRDISSRRIIRDDDNKEVDEEDDDENEGVALNSRNGILSSSINRADDASSRRTSGFDLQNCNHGAREIKVASQVMLLTPESGKDKCVVFMPEKASNLDGNVQPYSSQNSSQVLSQSNSQILSQSNSQNQAPNRPNFGIFKSSIGANAKRNNFSQAEYNKYLREAQSCEFVKDLEGAIASYCAALRVNDGNGARTVEIQRKVENLAKEMYFLDF